MIRRFLQRLQTRLGWGDELAIRPELSHAQFCADVHVATATLMATTQRPVTGAALSQSLATERPAWKDRPSWFVVAQEDRNIPAEVQLFGAQRAGSTNVRRMPGASHAVAVSHPDVVAETILATVAAAGLDPSPDVMAGAASERGDRRRRAGCQ